MTDLEREVSLVMRTARWTGAGGIEAIADRIESRAALHIRGRHHAIAVARELRARAAILSTLHRRSG